MIDPGCESHESFPLDLFSVKTLGLLLFVVQSDKCCTEVRSIFCRLALRPTVVLFEIMPNCIDCMSLSKILNKNLPIDNDVSLRSSLSNGTHCVPKNRLPEICHRSMGVVDEFDPLMHKVANFCWGVLCTMLWKLFSSISLMCSACVVHTLEFS